MNGVSIGSGNGLVPVRHQAITGTNAGLLSIGPVGTNFSEILIKIENFSFMKMHLKMSSAKWQPFCPGEDELKKDTIYHTWPRAIHRFLADISQLHSKFSMQSISPSVHSEFFLQSISPSINQTVIHRDKPITSYLYTENIILAAKPCDPQWVGIST